MIGHTRHFDLSSFGHNSTLVDCVFGVVEAAENQVRAAEDTGGAGWAGAAYWCTLGVGVGLCLKTAGALCRRLASPAPDVSTDALEPDAKLDVV